MTTEYQDEPASSMQLAESYFESADADSHAMGWMTLLLWATKQCHDDGTPKSQGTAFTGHIDQPVSSFLGASGFRILNKTGATPAPIAPHWGGNNERLMAA